MLVLIYLPWRMESWVSLGGKEGAQIIESRQSRGSNWGLLWVRNKDLTNCTKHARPFKTQPLLIYRLSCEIKSKCFYRAQQMFVKKEKMKSESFSNLWNTYSLLNFHLIKLGIFSSLKACKHLWALFFSLHVTKDQPHARACRPKSCYGTHTHAPGICYLACIL